VPQQLLSRVDEGAELDRLPGLLVNYDQGDAPRNGPAAAPGHSRAEPGHWHVDSGVTQIGQEAPGEPEPDGPWATACRLVSQYEFADARILRGVYRQGSELLGRNMLLEARFVGLRFYLGVRVTGIVDEERDTGEGPERAWGWSYQTLQGHLEQGRLSYEVIKNLATGQVMFRVAGYSRRAPIPNPVIRLGFLLFGRWTQQRFYRNIQARMSGLVRAARQGQPLPEPAVRPDGIVLAPSGTQPHPLEQLAVGWIHPGGAKEEKAMTTATVRAGQPAKDDLLGIYLNDHLAGATAGMGLARRAAAAAEPGSERAGLLRKTAAEITADRSALLKIMAALGIKVRGYKVFGAWAGEKAGYLKFNGHLLSRSPLSALEETEILRLGVTGKAAGWRTLRALADHDSRLDAAWLDELLDRASRQEDELEGLRVSLADQVFADGTG
jgi:uncharacterized protein (UPF0548 family)